MNEIGLIFDKNFNPNFKIDFKFNKKRMYQINNKYNILGGEFVKFIIDCFNFYYNKYKSMKIPIHIDLGECRFRDKLVANIFECIIYHIITNKKHRVEVAFSPKVAITTYGIKQSPLYDYSLSHNVERFETKFNLLISENKYRHVFPYDKNMSQIAKSLEDIANFIKNNLIAKNIDEKKAKNIGNNLYEIITELISNSIMYGKGKTIVDIDITPDTYKKQEEENIHYYGINITVINFSDTLFYEPLKNTFSELSHKSNQYKRVEDALESHKKYFNNNYISEDFFMIASFQNKVSGDLNSAKSGIGGTGLTKLIQAMQNGAEYDQCYMMSGNRILNFEQKVMNIDKEGFIAFNIENVFASPPLKGVISSSSTFFPGVAYMLSFVIKKE